jgi:hypothetical protein
MSPRERHLLRQVPPSKEDVTLVDFHEDSRSCAETVVAIDYEHAVGGDHGSCALKNSRNREQLNWRCDANGLVEPED